MKKAVLFLIFNRLDTTQKVFEQIKLAKPTRLYIASDGARTLEEKRVVESVRNWVLENIDWDCEVKTLFRENNLGCGCGVADAISWFFEHEEDGIILEDDCIPSQSFFHFCEELLDYYKDDKSVWHISGNQFVKNFKSNASYYFAVIQHCWGWATWRDRWEHFKFNIKDYDAKYLKNFSSDKRVQKYWADILNTLKTEPDKDIWDYQWTFEIVKNKGLCINPSVNLVTNIGFMGTHFSDKSNNPNLNLANHEMAKIIHPSEKSVDYKSVNYIYKNVFFIESNLFKIFMRKSKNFIKNKFIRRIKNAL